MTNKETLINYCLRMGDDTLILGHRLSEWCSNGPILEEDLALTNFALDMIGRAQALLAYAAELKGKNFTADDLPHWIPEVFSENLRTTSVLFLHRRDSWKCNRLPMNNRISVRLYDKPLRCIQITVFGLILSEPQSRIAFIVGNQAQNALAGEREARNQSTRIVLICIGRNYYFRSFRMELLIRPQFIPHQWLE